LYSSSSSSSGSGQSAAFHLLPIQESIFTKCCWRRRRKEVLFIIDINITAITCGT